VARRTLSGTAPLAVGQYPVPGDPVDPLLVTGLDSMPRRLPLMAAAWADHLCAAVGDWTDAELRALPAGTQDEHPCL
jgi:hypothetical protein